MSAGDLNYSSAISEGNSLSKSVREHNESIRQNNQLLVQAWNQQKNVDDKNAQQDKDIKGVEDAYGSFTAIGTIAQGYQRVNQLGVGGAFREDIGNIQNRAQQIADSVRGGLNKIRGGDQGGQAVSNAGSKPVDTNTGTVSTSEPNSQSEPNSATVDPEKTSGSVDTDAVDDVKNSVKDTSATEEISGKIVKGLKTAGKVGQVAGVIGGGVQLVEGVKDLADGSFAKMDAAHKASSILGDAGGLLDIASVFLPVLAPIAAVTSVASAVSSTINTIDDDKSKQSKDASSEQNQLNQNRANIENTTSFTSLGLVGNAQSSSIEKIQGTGAF
tara:strand:+ start:240 stop:1226 length:987 start_codon:yes stop_codon:yes gene_type:complete